MRDGRRPVGAYEEKPMSGVRRPWVNLSGMVIVALIATASSSLRSAP